MKVTTIRQQTVSSGGVTLSCPDCDREVEMLTTAQALRILGIDSYELYRMLDAGMVHSRQAVSGNRWICKDSLFHQTEMK